MQLNLFKTDFTKISFALKSLVILAYIGLIVLLPSLHSSNQNIITYHDSHRLLELTLILLTLAYSAIAGQCWTKVVAVDNKISIGISLILALACVSALLAHSPRQAVLEISMFVGLSYLALSIALQYLEKSDLFVKRLCYTLWLGALLYLVSFYVGYVTAILSKTALSWPKPFSGFTNIRSFNQYQLWGLGLIYLPLLTFDIKRATRLGLSIALCLWWVLLFYSASRGVLIAWFFGMLTTWLVYKKLAWPFLRMQITSLITGFLGYEFLFKIIPNSLALNLATSSVLRQTTSDRTDLWARALSLAYEHPIFGIGPMNYPWYNASLSHPHNSVIQLACEWGLPATLIMLLITGYAVYCWLKQIGANKIKNESNFNCNLVIVLLFSICTNFAYSMVDGVIVMPISQVLMATIIGLTIAVYASLSKTTPPLIATRTKTEPVLATILIVALVWSTLPEIKQALSGNQKRFSTGYVAAGPRIWWEIK